MRWVESPCWRKMSSSTSSRSFSSPSTTGCVVVDDLVEDRPDGRRGAHLEQVGVLLEALARGPQDARLAVAHGDHVAGADEEVDLAELDLLLVIVVARGPQDDEEAVALVVLELGTLVADAGVLDRQLVEAESLRDPLELLLRGLVEPQPDELAAALAELRRLLGADRALVLAGAVAVVGAVDDHGPPEGFDPGQPYSRSFMRRLARLRAPSRRARARTRRARARIRSGTEGRAPSASPSRGPRAKGPRGRRAER